MQSGLAAALIVVALSQPIAGFVFVLDGVLIGAGDGRWLALAQVGPLVLYLALILAVRTVGPSLLAGTDSDAAQGHALTVLWLTFVVFMTMRGVALGWGARGDARLITGATG